MVFGQVLVSSTLEQKKIRLPRFLGQKFPVVPYSLFYITQITNRKKHKMQVSFHNNKKESYKGIKTKVSMTSS